MKNAPAAMRPAMFGMNSNSTIRVRLSPIATAPATKSVLRRLSACARSTRASAAQLPRPIISIVANAVCRPRGTTPATTIASGRIGRARKIPVTALSTVSARPGNAPAAQPQPTASTSAIAVAPTISSRVSGAAVSTCESTSCPSRVVPNGCGHEGGASRPLSIDKSEPSPGATNGPIRATPATSPSSARPTHALLFWRRGASRRFIARAIVWPDARLTAIAGYARRVIESEPELRDVIGSPSALVAGKVAGRLNDLTRQFIERSPFLCIATARPDGGLDVSPRGDPAGFVRILDERTLLLPDRPGNKLADTLTNLLADDRVALLFLIPGVGDSFRVNGRASVTDDAALLAASTIDGKAPKLGILVAIEEAYTQCSKALIRSDLWNPEKHIGRNELPSGGEILRSISDPELDSDQYDRERAERYARGEGLY